MTKSSPIKLVLQTPFHQWVIPHNSACLKMLIRQQSINPNELLFESDVECQCFVKQLFLMATVDEQYTQKPSILANFARQLMSTTISSEKYYDNKKTPFNANA